MVDQSNKSPLSEAGVVALLMRLYESDDNVMQDDLKDIIPNFDTRKKRIAELARADLVVETLAMMPRKTIILKLTPRGTEAVKMLSTIVNMAQVNLPVKDRAISMKYAVPIIRMINQWGKIKVNDLLELMPFYVPIKKKLIPALIDNNIAVTYREETGHKAEFIELTVLGKMMALGLDEMQKIIDN